MAAPRHASPANAAYAIQNASRAALVMAVAAAALIGADTAIAVNRTAGASHAHSSAVTQTTPPATSPPAHIAARPLLAMALADALAKRSVHTYARAVSKRYGIAIFNDDDARSGGIQRIAIYGGHVTVRVIGRATYFTGDKRGLTRYLGFSAHEAAALGGHWFKLTPGQSGYNAVTAGVTLASTLQEIAILGRLTVLPRQTIRGVPAVGIRGHGLPKHSVATMWISTGTDPLPLEFDGTGAGSQLTETFSAWGTPIELRRPSNVFRSQSIST